MPPGYEQVFADLLSRANRANVSFYGIDVRGLQLSTPARAAPAPRSPTPATISASQRQAGSETAVTREQATQDDTMQTSMRSDVVETLDAPLDEHRRLPRHPDERLRPAARAHRGGHPRLLRGVLRPVRAAGARAVPQDRGARRAQGRAGAVAQPATTRRRPSRPGRPRSRPSLPGRAADRLRGAEPLLPLRAADGGPFDCLIKVEASLAKAEFKETAAQDGPAPGKHRARRPRARRERRRRRDLRPGRRARRHPGAGRGRARRRRCRSPAG